MKSINTYPARMYFVLLPAIPVGLAVTGNVLISIVALAFVIASMWFDPLVKQFVVSHPHRKFLIVVSVSGFIFGFGHSFFGLFGLVAMLVWCLGYIVASVMLPFDVSSG